MVNDDDQTKCNYVEHMSDKCIRHCNCRGTDKMTICVHIMDNDNVTWIE